MGWLTDPVVIECVAVVVLTLVGMVLAHRMRRIAARLDSIRSLGDLIAGLNEHFRGNHEAALALLERALATDPTSVEARIALGDCHRELGNLAEAHKHHTHVRVTFGIDEVENLRSLALDHELRGDLEQASACMAEVFARHPHDIEAARACRRLAIARGDFVAAAALQEEIVQLCQRLDPDERGHEDAELARLNALAGEALLNAGDAVGARRHLADAVARAPHLVSARMHLVRATMAAGDAEGARLVFERQLAEIENLATTGSAELSSPSARALQAGARAVVTGEALQALPGAARAPLALPGPAASRLPELAAPQKASRSTALAAPRTTRTFLEAVLPRHAELACADCGRSAGTWQELCPHCEAPGSLYSVYTAERRQVPELVDIVREATGGLAHHRSLIERATSGDEGAAAKLTRLGPDAVGNILAELPATREPLRALEIVVGMGAGAFGEFLDAYVRIAPTASHGSFGRRIRGIGSYADAVVWVARGIGPSVLPILYERLERARSTLADLSGRIALELVDPIGVGERWHLFDARRLLETLTQLDTATTTRLVRATPPQSPLVTALFAAATWRAEETLVEVIKDDRGHAVAREILRHRGISPRFIKRATSLLGDRSYAQVLVTFLASVGDEALLGFAPAVFDERVAAEVRVRVAEELATRYARDPLPLVALLGQSTLTAESELRRALAGLEDSALDALALAFARRQHRVLGSIRPLARRDDQRVRLALAEAIVDAARHGAVRAATVALELRGGEDDAEVRRALDRAIAAQGSAPR